MHSSSSACCISSFVLPLDPIKLPVPSSLHCLDFLLLSEDCSKLYAQLQLLLFFLFQYHILFVFFLLIHYECDVTNAIMPPMINNGKAMYISPPITIPINITGKKITVQSSFIIPQDALNPKTKNFPTNQIIQIANNNDNIFFSFWNSFWYASFIFSVLFLINIQMCSLYQAYYWMPDFSPSFLLSGLIEFSVLLPSDHPIYILLFCWYCHYNKFIFHNTRPPWGIASLYFSNFENSVFIFLCTNCFLSMLTLL